MRLAVLVALVVALPAAPPLLGAAPENPHAVAVVIGNRIYKGGVPEVRFAHDDAEAVKRFLIERLGYREGNVIDLRDAGFNDLRRVFGSELSPEGQLFNWVRPGKSDVFVFYSGHGVPGLKDKRGYLLPVDGDPNFAEVTAYQLDVLYANLAGLPARSVTVALDACFSGNTPEGPVIQAISGLSVEPRLPKATDRLTILTAASGDEVASWDEEHGHGLFTWHLLEALGGRADTGEWGDGDGRVTLQEVEAYLGDEMAYQARRRYGRQQTPTVEGEPDRIVALVPETAASGPAPTPPPGPDARGPRPATAEPPTPSAAPATGASPADGGRSAGERAEMRERSDQGAADGRGGGGGRGTTDVAVASLPPPTDGDRAFRPGERFRDCPDCPELIVVPAGRFEMGSPEDEVGRENHEGPRHEVEVERPFALGRFEVTFAQWDACVAAGGCPGPRDDAGFGRDDHPVINVTAADAEAYAAWLGEATGHTYRLPSEAEWEYAARAGSSTPYPWGDEVGDGRANCDGCAVGGGRSSPRRPLPVGGFEPNAFGLHDMTGNVWEWTADCWNSNHADAPATAVVRSDGRCDQRVVRGGSWVSRPHALRSANRAWAFATEGSVSRGFRVLRELVEPVEETPPEPAPTARASQG